jgi:hypothetical protein
MAPDHEGYIAGHFDLRKKREKVATPGKTSSSASISWFAAIVRAAEMSHTGVQPALAVPPGIGDLGVNRLGYRHNIHAPSLGEHSGEPGEGHVDGGGRDNPVGLVFQIGKEKVDDLLVNQLRRLFCEGTQLVEVAVHHHEVRRPPPRQQAFHCELPEPSRAQDPVNWFLHGSLLLPFTPDQGEMKQQTNMMISQKVAKADGTTKSSPVTGGTRRANLEA